MILNNQMPGGMGQKILFAAAAAMLLLCMGKAVFLRQKENGRIPAFFWLATIYLALVFRGDFRGGNAIGGMFIMLIGLAVWFFRK